MCRPTVSSGRTGNQSVSSSLVAGNFTFPPTARLQAASEYKRVFDNATKVHGRGFTLFCCLNGSAVARLGLAVSKKNVRQAAGRNRIKRLVRESFRLNRQELAGFDVIFLARKGIDAQSNAEIASALASAWRKVGKLCVSS